MNRKTRKVLHGLSLAGLVAAGSIPLMGVADAATKKCGGGKPAGKYVKTQSSAKAKTNANAKSAKTNANVKAGQQK